eukprot:947505-Pyramimonas_sp.AAC.1
MTGQGFDFAKSLCTCECTATMIPVILETENSFVRQRTRKRAQREHCGGSAHLFDFVEIAPAEAHTLHQKAYARHQ